MKKRVIAMIMSACLLAGCGTQDPGNRGSIGSGKEETPTVAEIKPAEEPAALPTQQPQEPENAKEKVFSRAFQLGAVEGNGKHFVRVDRNVYYRVTDPKAYPSFALYDEFISGEDPDVASKLCCYNLDSHEYQELLDVYGRGGFFVGTEGLFLGNDMEMRTSLIDPKSGEVTDYCEGIPVDVSEDGELLAVSYWTSAGEIYSIYRDGEKLVECNSEENNIAYFFGFAGDQLLGLVTPGEGEFSICSLDSTGIIHDLGEVPEVGSDGSWYYPEPNAFVRSGDKAWFSLCYYEGTAHYLADWQVLYCEAGSEGSLQLLKEADDNADSAAPILVRQGDSVEVWQGMNGRMDLQEEGNGFLDLVWYEKPGKPMVLAPRFLYDHMADGLTEWKDFLSESVIYDETAFTISCTAERIREQDIGWREAYKAHDVQYRAIPFDENSREDDGSIMYPITLAMEFYSSPIPELSELVGRWELYSYEGEGGFGLAEDDPTIDRAIEIYEDGNGTLEFYDNGTGKYDKADMVLFDNEAYAGRPSWKVQIKDWNEEEHTAISLIEDRLEISVEWKYNDGTPGGCDYVYHRVTE